MAGPAEPTGTGFTSSPYVAFSQSKAVAYRLAPALGLAPNIDLRMRFGAKATNGHLTWVTEGSAAFSKYLAADRLTGQVALFQRSRPNSGAFYKLCNLV